MQHIKILLKTPAQYFSIFHQQLNHILISKNQLNQLSSIGSKYFSSYRSSPIVSDDLSEYPEVEIIQNPPEWKYVERLLPRLTIPKPLEKNEYPSGWKPAQPLKTTSKYNIARTKNHMIPVYLQRSYRGQRRLTIIRRIEGDIWQLEKELREIVEKYRNGKTCASRINELSGQIHFHGDYVNLIKDYLMSKGY